MNTQYRVVITGSSFGIFSGTTQAHRKRWTDDKTAVDKYMTYLKVDSPALFRDARIEKRQTPNYMKKKQAEWS